MKKLQSFLGLINFSLRFVPHLATITQPLRNLLVKGHIFNWTSDCQQSFEHVKRLVQQVSTLSHPDFTKPFKLQTDASNHGLGAVLLQQDDMQQWRPISYISRSLTKSERNYSTTEKELLAIVWAFQKWHPYLHGTTITVKTDHQMLIALNHKHHPPGRLLRWALALQAYQFTLQYCRGTDNTLADTLFRTEQQATQVTSTKSPFPLRPEQLAEAQHQDHTLCQVISRIQSAQPTTLTKQYIIINHVLHRLSREHPPRVCIPKALQGSYLQFYHGHPLSGHLGFHKVLLKLRSTCYWPRMRQDISFHLKQCPTCQQIKSPSQKVGTLCPITVSHPFEMVGWDLMGPFPTSRKGNKYILVMTEYLTRWCEAEPIADTSASTIASVLLRKIIFPHGFPAHLLSIQGPQFRGEVMQVLTTSMGIQQKFTTPYHPQTNGLTERMNRTLKQIISSFIDPLHQDWDEILPFAVHAYNTSVQASTRVSPFRALYGRDPHLPPNIHSIKLSPKHTDAAD